MVKRIRDIAIGLLTLSIIACLWIVPRGAFAVEVIAHPSLSSSELTDSKLRRIYTMKIRHWPDQQPIQLFVFPSDSHLHNDFTKRVLKMFPYQLDRIWNKLAFSGAGVMPTEVATEEEMIRLVNTTPGAIGYIESQQEGGVNIVYRESGD